MKKQIVSMKRGAQKGFTLIELMIVVAIIAILSAFALPAYQDYTIRTRVAEGLNLASSAKVAITEYYTNYHAWPSDNSNAGLVAASNINGNGVSKVEVGANGKITVTYNSRVDPTNNTIIFQATPSDPNPGDSIKWNCQGGSVKAQYRPAECR